jgi:pimeloyl-ACP methyl ester carboxylesterase
MDVRESSLGIFPCLVAGSGPPLVLLSGLAPEAGVSTGSLRRMHESAMRPWARGKGVFYVNRLPGLPRGMTMAALAAEHAEALREAFDDPVDLLGASTGGSIAQQLAAEHGDVVRRLVLVSTGCRLGPNAKLVQRQIAARVRAGATRQAAAVMAGALVPPPLRLPGACLGWLLGARLFSAQAARSPGRSEPAGASCVRTDGVLGQRRDRVEHARRGSVAMQPTYRTGSGWFGDGLGE